nr:uncharacterized protein LOC111516016 [Leptinotarsa decemlineata]
MSASVGGLLLFSLIIFLLRRILRRRAVRNREGNNQSNISDTVEMIVPNGCNEMEKKEPLELLSSSNEDKKLWLENQLLQTRIVDVRIGNKLNGITETLPKYQGFDTLENNIKPKLIKILKNQDILLQKVAKLEVALSKMKNVIKNEKNHENMKVDNMFEPIDNIQDLNSLEDKLKDKDIFDEFLRKTNEICTLNRKISNTAKDDCCHVIDYFFTRNFMTQCSWTGACKERNMEKIPFKIYKNVIALFFEVIHLSNKTFTKQHCETFFKNVMKNSTRRNNNSATSRQTKSKNLKLCFLGTNNTVTESSNREMETVHHEEKEGQQNSVHD